MQLQAHLKYFSKSFTSDWCMAFKKGNCNCSLKYICMYFLIILFVILHSDNN